MLDKLAELEKTYEELTAQLGDPELLADPKRLAETSKTLSDLKPTIDLYQQLQRIDAELADNQELMQSLAKGDELYELATSEKEDLAEQKASVIAALKIELTPKDPNDKRNVVLEIRAGTGGDEATLFAHDLFRMYSRFAEIQRWKVQIIDLSESGIRGIKDVSAIIEGKGAYSRLKYEAGVHRVQRVPETESSGRIHTSAVTVAVLPEADDVEIEVKEKDLRVDRYCSSGPGGQGVNTTYSAVRLTHLPTGLVVTCQDERSQIKNKAKALRVLKSRLLEIEHEKANTALSQERKKMVGSGDRSEKIRTYNFPQSRVTDHRIGLTLHQLQAVLEGQLDAVIDPLVSHFQAEQMQDSVS